MLIHMDGFDHYGADTSNMTDGPYNQVDADFSLSGANQRTGVKSLRRSSASSSSIVLKALGSEQTSLGVGCALYLDSMPNTFGSYKFIDIRDKDNEIQFTLYIEPNGMISVRLSERLSLIGQTRSNVIIDSSYNHIEVASIPDSEALFELSGFCGDIGSLSYDGLSKDVSSQTAFPWDMAISPDGTKVIVHSKFTTPELFQYTLSTAYDISTASYDSVSASVSGQSNEPHGLHVVSNGDRLYISDDGTGAGTTPGVFQYNFSTGWDLSTLSYSGKSISLPSGFAGFFDVTISSDGSKLFALMRNSGELGFTIIEYALSSPYEIDTASETGVQFDLSSELVDAHSLELSSDGQKLYVLARLGNTIYQYSLLSSNMLSTAEFSNIAFSVSEQSSDAHGFAINESNGSVYIVDDPDNTIYQYSSQCFLTVSDGVLEIRVNGVTELSLSNAKSTFTESKEYSFVAIRCGGNGDHGVTSDIDDYYIWNGSGSWNNSFLGDRRCYLLKPNQDTNISDFDPSSGNFGYKMIDDESPDDDSTYIIAEAYLQSGSPLTGTSEFKIEDLPNGSSLISGINVVARASKTDNTSAEIYTSINSGADSLSASAHTLTTSYVYYNDIYEYDPSLVSSFTKDSLNSISVSITADDLDPGATFDSPAVDSPAVDSPPTDYDARYLMNESTGSPTLVDETGSYNGTTNTVTSVAAVEGNGLQVTGSTPSRINLTAIPTDPTIFALSGWAYVPTGGDRHFMLAHRDDATALIQLAIESGLLKYQVRSSTSSIVQLTSEPAILDEFFHFVFNWNKTGTSEVWINGVLIYEDATNFSGNFNSTISAIGPFNNGLGYTYGNIAAISDIYTVWRTRNLTPTEIAAIYAAESP